MRVRVSILAVMLLLVAWMGSQGCTSPPEAPAPPTYLPPEEPYRPVLAEPYHLDTLVLDYAVNIGCYFEFMDSLVQRYDTIALFPLDEHLIVWTNPWIVDTLADTDYYIRRERGEIVYNQEALEVLRPGDTLFIPNTELATGMLARHDRILLDLNIPEYRLRIFEDTSLLHSFLVRVGQSRQRYLAMSGHETDLRTDTGRGTIVRINRSPVYINPVDNKIYTVTHRDDGEVTLLPRIPWIEPELNGRRPGHLIHPTTNQKTLGKAWSNGCVGTRESDAWRIYYHAPPGTAVHFRYDLKVVQPGNDTVYLRDIYGYGIY